MIPEKYITDLQRANKYFSSNRYIDILLAARKALDESRFSDFENVMKSIPTNDELFSRLVEKLKGKSVYKTLKKLIEKKVDNNYDSLKCLFSLGTHTAIECKINPEYKALLPVIYEKIAKMIYELE